MTGVGTAAWRVDASRHPNAGATLDALLEARGGMTRLADALTQEVEARA